MSKSKDDAMVQMQAKLDAAEARAVAAEAELATAQEPIKVADPNDYLPEALKGKVKVINWTGGHTQVFGRYGTVNLTKLSLQRATSLVRGGFSKLELIKD